MVGLGIKKGDIALVMTGKNKGKKGRILSVSPAAAKITIEGINIIKRHTKPNKTYSQGGIIEKEGPIHISNVMFVCPKCSKPTRIGNTVLDGGKKLRTCKKCKEVLD
ncbi:MAG: 50S ribosomal protein L24 [Dissulfurispiraceae bacterium]